MSDRRQTSIFQMREMADVSEFHHCAKDLITTDSVDRYAHRNVDELRRAAENCESISAMVSELGSNRRQIRQWANVYDVNLPRNRTMASKLQRLDANEVRGD